jgi:hypothetical protein
MTVDFRRLGIAVRRLGIVVTKALESFRAVEARDARRRVVRSRFSKTRILTVLRRATQGEGIGPCRYSFANTARRLSLPDEQELAAPRIEALVPAVFSTDKNAVLSI